VATAQQIFVKFDIGDLMEICRETGHKDLGFFLHEDLSAFLLLTTVRNIL